MPKGNPYKKLASLSPRQREVLQLLCQGKQYKEIAEALVIEKSTVKAHMAGVYKKLGLIELKRDERIFQIKSIYCPMLQEKEKPEIIDVPYEDIVDESEPDEISPELDEMVSSDEYAIVKYEGENITMSADPNVGKGKRSGLKRFFRTVFVLIILVMVGFGGLYIWQNFFLKPDETPQGISQPEVITDVISEAFYQGKTQKEYYDVGEWVEKGDVWLRIRDYDIDNMGIIEINIEVWNKSSNDLLFSYNPGINFKMTDNTGHIYDLWGPCEISALDNEVIDAQDVEKINFKATTSTVTYSDEAIFNSDVTDLYLAMDGFSVFDSVKFLIPIR
ncbi:MAG: helix-turn-helix transcriptional regulator [Brevefilum sp.]|nr:helix-turn-helix transcriptional regulator [Brevefilum sp.]